MNTPAPGKAQMAWDVFTEAFLAGAPNAKREGMRILLQSRGLLTDQGLVVNPEEAWLAVRHYQSPAIAAPPAPQPKPAKPKPKQRTIDQLLNLDLDTDPITDAEYDLLQRWYYQQRASRNRLG